MKRNPQYFYGYWILSATFICLVISSGTVWWSFSLFVKPIQSELFWSRSSIMLAFTIYVLTMGVMSPFIGRMVDRFGARRVILFGAVISGISLMTLTFVESIWHFYFIHILLGFGGASMGHIAQSTIVSKWFQKRKGFALGIMSTGVGMGGLVLAPIVGIALIPSLGWRISYLILGMITWITIIPLTLFILKNEPTEMILRSNTLDSTELVSNNKLIVNATVKGLKLKEALATITLWLIALSFLTSAFSQGSILHNEVVYITDIGFPFVLASSLHGFVGLASASGKIFFGWLCDYINPKYVFALGHATIICAILLLLSVNPDSSEIRLWLYTIVFGFGLGSWLPTMATLVIVNFGLMAYGTIMGITSLAQSFGASMGPLITNIIYENTGTYRLAFEISLSLYAIALPTILIIRRPKCRQ